MLFGGTPGKLIPLWKTGRILPLLSKPILDEYLKVLAYPKFELSEEEINYILYIETLPFFDVVFPVSDKNIVKNDPTDDKFIHCAIAGSARVLISGDNHLLSIESYQEFETQTPMDFLGRFTARI